MPLSPSDVHDKQFKLVRQTTGYDMDEVDAFLDEVELEIARLNTLLAQAQQGADAAGAELASAHAEVNAAQAELASVRAELASVQAELSATQAELRGITAELSAAQLAARAVPAEQAPPVAVPVVEQAPVAAAAAAPGGAGEPSTLAAARLLELAQRTADEYIAAAQQEGEQIVSEARLRADESLRDLAGERANLEQRVHALAGLQQDLQERLRGYLEGQLRELDALSEQPAQM